MKIGFTSTIPVEILFASGNIPLDLNNIFISQKNPNKYIDFAELEGLPRTYCCWIKGIYSAVKKHKMKKVVSVFQGDCTNSKGLCELLGYEGVEIIPFCYPIDRNKKSMEQEIEKLMKVFKVSWIKLCQTARDMQAVREKIYKMDNDRNISSFDSHYFQVASTDFEGDYKKFEKKLDVGINKKRQVDDYRVELGFIGVPSIVSDIFQFIDSSGARIVLHESARQFTFPYLKSKKITKTNFKDIYIKQFLEYTYPYEIGFRLRDIENQIKKRNIRGIIHYVQSFCYKALDDVLIRKKLDVPVLTLEEDRPGKLSRRAKTRIEAFVNMLR
ncbi:2-hydroxyacyl-CoA dehydratase family protein [bacterium]